MRSLHCRSLALQLFHCVKYESFDNLEILLTKQKCNKNQVQQLKSETNFATYKSTLSTTRQVDDEFVTSNATNTSERKRVKIKTFLGLSTTWELVLVVPGTPKNITHSETSFRHLFARILQNRFAMKQFLNSLQINQKSIHE